MPTLSYDGQSLLIDGRRLWLVSGTMYYPRIPQALWRRRIRAAKSAGLNCINVPVFWSVHEPKPGPLTFDGQADLGQFIQLIAAEGLYCILRPGPYINADADLGGLPAWLLPKNETKLRQATPGFLEATARYLSAVLAVVKDFQANAISGGPIVLMQAEHQWLSHHLLQTTGYLREIVRYLREAGCTVPIVSANNLWQHVDGTIDVWSANSHLSSDLRQLRAIHPQAPVMAVDLPTAQAERWGGPRHPGVNADEMIHRLAQVLAVGGQFNLSPFHGGTNFDFLAGRSCEAPDAFLATANAPGAPLNETGRPGRSLPGVKRIATFATHFGHVLAHAEHQPQTIASPDQHNHALSIIHQGGAQGDVVFILRPADDQTQNLELLLPDGLTLQVPLGDEQVAWLVARVNLAGVAELTRTNLRPWAFIAKRMLVLFGPPGAAGLVNLNGTPLTVTVPSDDQPAVARHEGLTVVVLNTAQVDAACILPAGLAIGALELDDSDQPVPIPGRKMLVIGLDGAIEERPAKKPRPAAPPRLAGWTYANLDSLLAGTSTAYKSIPGPRSLEALSPSIPYGWYALKLPAPANGAMLIPDSGGRLHLYTNSKSQALLGLGPGADNSPAALRLTPHTTILAETPGRFTDGWNLAQPTGLPGHIHQVAPFKLPRPTRDHARLPDPFTLNAYLKHLRHDDRATGDWIRWKFTLPAKTPLIVDISGLARRAILVANGQPVGLYDPIETAGLGRFLLEPGQALKTGRNEVALAFFDRLPPGKTPPADVIKHTTVYRSTAIVTAKAEWFFAPWSMPVPSDFTAKSPAAALPAWARCAFNLPHNDSPLRLALDGLSKGVAFLNGHNLGRYFVATPDGQKVGPQDSLYLPEPWLKTDAPNDLTIFDEHGRNAGKCVLKFE